MSLLDFVISAVAKAAGLGEEVFHAPPSSFKNKPPSSALKAGSGDFS